MPGAVSFNLELVDIWNCPSLSWPGLECLTYDEWIIMQDLKSDLISFWLLNIDCAAEPFLTSLGSINNIKWKQMNADVGV